MLVKYKTKYILSDVTRSSYTNIKYKLSNVDKFWSNQLHFVPMFKRSCPVQSTVKKKMDGVKNEEKMGNKRDSNTMYFYKTKQTLRNPLSRSVSLWLSVVQNSHSTSYNDKNAMLWPRKQNRNETRNGSLFLPSFQIALPLFTLTLSFHLPLFAIFYHSNLSDNSFFCELVKKRRNR